MSYSENILQAVDMVVSQRLNEMSFDKTIVCKVIDDKNAKSGEYTVSYQAMTMVVYASNPEEEYRTNQEVYVTVPQGDFNLRKIIIGYVSPNEVPVYLYTNPMKYLVRLSDNLIADGAILNTANLSAAANNGNDIILRDYSEEGGMPPIKYLCFAADFKTEVKKDGSGNPVQVDYQTPYEIIITATGILKPDEEKENPISIEWKFSSTEFQGNPFQFNGLFKQEQLFNIESYQELRDLAITLNNTNETINVTVSNIELVYGYAEVDLTDDVKNGKIIIYEKGSKSTYSQDAEDILNISIKYFNNNSIQPNENINGKITWFRYDITQKDDEGNGKHWAKIIEQNDSELIYQTNKDQKSIQIMAKLTIDNNTYISNNLVFLREDQKDIEGALKGSGIDLTASEDGSYFIYDGTTMLVNEDLKKNKSFRITAKLTGAAKWNPGTEIRWYIPKFGTMIAPPDASYLQTGETIEGNIDSTTDEKYYIITRTIAGEIPYQSFDIKDKYDISATSNVIRCEAGEGEDKVDDGVLLTFGISGSQGTEYTMAITFDKDSPTYAFIDTSGNFQHNNVLTAVAHLYKPDGTEDENVNFYWGGENTYISLTGSDQDTIMYSPVNLEVGQNFPEGINYYTYNSENKEYTKVTEDTIQENIQYYKEEFYKGKTCKITVDTDAFDTGDYYGIISATINNYEMNDGRNITFKAFLAIPVWWANHSEVEMHGPTSVIYDFQGMNPKYSNEEYTLDNSTPYNTTYFNSSNKDSGIKVVNNKLLMPELISTTIPKITVVIQKDEEWLSGLYFQPIAISRNQYTSAILNSWNDNKQFNDGTTILTKMIGAGDKDAQGRFSGVFMGAVGKETEDGVTGLYGYQDGELRFKFTEKGEAYIGTGADNCIAFNTLQGGDAAGADLNRLTIRTKHFTLDTEGVYLSNIPEQIDEAKKYLFRLGPKTDPKLSFDNSGNLIIKGKITAISGQIGGWFLTNSRMYYPDDGRGVGAGFVLDASAPTNPVFYAGYDKDLNEDDTDYPTGSYSWRKHTAFAISHDGTVRIGYTGNRTTSNALFEYNPSSNSLTMRKQDGTAMLTINSAGFKINTEAIDFNASDYVKASVSGKANKVGWSLTTDGFSISSNNTAVFNIDTKGNATFKGRLEAATGKFKGTLEACTITTTGGLKSGCISINKESVSFGEVDSVEGDASLIEFTSGGQIRINARNGQGTFQAQALYNALLAHQNDHM